MTYTCKHCGQQVPALTICNCRGALIEHYLEELDRHGWTGLKELAAEIKALNSNLRVALRKNDSLQVQLAEYRDTVTHWQAENERLRKVFDATWDALDGLYGAGMGEVIPVTLLPEDRQQLFNRVLEVVGETGVMEMLEEEGK